MAIIFYYNVADKFCYSISWLWNDIYDLSISLYIFYNSLNNSNHLDCTFLIIVFGFAITSSGYELNPFHFWNAFFPFQY